MLFCTLVLFFTSGCIKKEGESNVAADSSSDQQKIYSGFSTDFEKFGEPYGGCGVPEKLLYDADQKKLPYIALNVQNTAIDHPILPRPILDADKIGLWDNGKNCGRWIEITVSNDCRNAPQQAHEGKICVQSNGDHGPQYYDTVDELNNKTLYGVIADSCQDPNYWCRDSVEHIDISTHEVNDMLKEWGSDRTKWNNRMVTWKFIDGPPAKFRIEEPKFAWGPNAMPYWPAVIVYNLKNGLSKVEIKTESGWIPAKMNSDMGQLWILGSKENSRKSGSDYIYIIRIYDYNENLLGSYELILPATCESGCPDILEISARPLNE